MPFQLSQSDQLSSDLSHGREWLNCVECDSHIAPLPREMFAVGSWCNESIVANDRGGGEFNCKKTAPFSHIDLI